MSTAATKPRHRTSQTMRSALDRVLAEQGMPTAWSVIVTVLGDAVLPRGGRIWTGSLIDILALIGLGGGVLRTALSRLVADGWLDSAKVGRRSFYELTQRGQDETLRAARRIYRTTPPAWNGQWQVALLTEGDTARRSALRQALAGRGFSAASPDAFVRLAAEAEAPEAVLAGTTIITGRTGDAAAARALAGRAWNLDAIAQGYGALERHVTPLLDAPLPTARDAGDALAARILLVHELRRVVLRDPELPSALLPQDWIGARVRNRIADRYVQLRAASEDWLDRNAEGGDGPLPPADRTAQDRFSDRSRG